VTRLFISYKIADAERAALEGDTPMMRLFPPFFFPVIIAGSALFGTVYGLLRHEWLSAGVSACVLLIAVAWARTISEPTHTFRDHAGPTPTPTSAVAGL
jgi:hypothetical protein